MVKKGGVSWNTNSDKKGVMERHKCDTCGRHYKMAWALQNQKKVCDNV